MNFSMVFATATDVDDSLQTVNERRQIVNHDSPQNVKVNLVVAVNKPVAEADDLRPRDLRVASALLLRQPGSGFTDDLQQSDQSQVKLAVAVEINSRLPLDHLQRFAGVIVDVA